MVARRSKYRKERELEIETTAEIRRLFEEKRRLLGVEAVLELVFLDHAPVVDEYVYGEAFPFERPPRVKLEVVAMDATTEEISEALCDELIHIQDPKLEQYIPDTMKETEDFKRRVQDCLDKSKR